MKLRHTSQPEPEVNLTSLIDVVLLLLVFFMVTTSFVRESELTIRLPEVADTGRTIVERGELEITVIANGSYFVNNRALIDSQPATLRAAISKLMPQLDAAQRVTIIADAQASHQSVVTAMDVAGKLGFVEINIATVSSTEQSE
jgi:biopolymer transport protein ExbD